VVDADIQDCFGTIDHAKLLRVIEQRVNDRRVLKLLRKWLEAGVMVDGEIMPSTGTAQGNPISPLLANAFLHWLDRLWAKRGSRLGELVRYCDDPCATRLHWRWGKGPPEPSCRRRLQTTAGCVG